MNFPNKIIAVSAIAFLVSPSFSGIAMADPAPTVKRPDHIRTPFRLISDGGTDKRFPPSYILDEPSFEYFDKKLKDLENNETKLLTENAKLRESADDNHWLMIGGIFVAGILVGGYLGTKY